MICNIISKYYVHIDKLMILNINATYITPMSYVLPWQCLVMFGLIGGCRLQAIDEYERQLDWTLDSDAAVS